MRPTWSSPYRASYRNAETPAVYALMAIMGVVFIIDFFTHGLVTGLLAWPVTPASLSSLQLWRPFTFPFAHGTGFLQILFDLILLWWAGGSLERAWASAKFLFFFFACGIVAGLATMAISPWFGGAVFFGLVGGWVGMVVAFAAMNPYQPVLFFIFPMQARWLAAIVIAFEIFARTGLYGGPIPAVVAVAATIGFAYVFTTGRFSLGRMFPSGGPSLKERIERWQQRRRMRQWQRRVSRAERPEDLFKD